MSGLYSRYYNLLRRNGMTDVMTFISTGLYSTSQTWGVLEASDQDPTQSPKYMGIKNYTAQHSTCTSSDLTYLQKSPFTCNESCSYSGVCVAENQCECFYGASGEYCQISKYTEHVDLCGYKCTFGQGDCLPSYVSGMDRYWACSCHAPFYGAQCSLFDCVDSCHYNGLCLNPNLCKCYPGYNGTYCETDCGCSGHGTCSKTSSSPSGATCLCDEGWTWSPSLLRCVASCRSASDLATTVVAVDSSAQQCAGPDQPKCAPSCVYGDCIDGHCACWAGFGGPACSTEVFRPNNHSSIGTNLGGVSYWTTEWAFVDAMKSSSDWVSNYISGWFPTNSAWGSGPPINVRADGYPSFLSPGQSVSKLLLRDVQLHTPSGVFVCLYDGDGEIGFSFDATILTAAKGRIEFRFSPTSNPACAATDATYCGDNGILLTIKATNPANPIHNIRVIMPGFESTYEKQPFHPLFLKNLAHYSVIRYMTWQNANSDSGGDWSQRPKPGNATMTSVPLEYMIALSNTLGAHPWFCIPFRATDAYLTNMTAMVRRLLRPDLKVT